MIRSFNRLGRAGLVFWLSFLPAVWSSPLWGLQENEAILFAEDAFRLDAETPGEPHHLRTRTVSLSLGPKRLRWVLEQERDLRLDLFGDVSFLAVLSRLEKPSPHSLAWIGRVPEVEHSQVVLVLRNGTLTGNISTPEALFQVRPGEKGLYSVSEIDEAAFPPESEPIEVFFDESIADHPDFSSRGGAPSIDVMVLYTGAAGRAAGGTGAIEALIDLAVAETNASYTNSNIRHRIRLVHSAEVSYRESGSLNSDLERLQKPSDGHLDSAHHLRDAHGADEVVLVVEGGCGTAYMMSRVTTEFSNFAFAVVSRLCVAGNYSLAHELGHTLGARHDRFADPTSNQPFGFNHGYVDLSGPWRTVMAYRAHCLAQGLSDCRRLPYWSSPTLFHEGRPLGDHLSDNRRVLESTAALVAAFRTSVFVEPPLSAPTGLRRKR